LKKYVGVAATIAAFAVLWQVLSMLVARPFLPDPASAVLALAHLASGGELWRHVGISLFRVACALGISSAAALALGIAAGRSPRIDNIVSPAIYLFHPLPKAAFLPIIMLFFGIGEVARIVTIIFIIFGQMLVAVRDAARQVPGEYLDAARALGSGRLGALRHVIMPAILPGFFTGFRISLGVAVAVLFIAETFVSGSGLGHLIIDAWTRIAYPEMYAAILAMSIMGLTLFIITDIVEYFLCPWQNTGSALIR
jgi:NitT/TauT family transport system permease protein